MAELNGPFSSVMIFRVVAFGPLPTDADSKGSSLVVLARPGLLDSRPSAC